MAYLITVTDHSDGSSSLDGSFFYYQRQFPSLWSSDADFRDQVEGEDRKAGVGILMRSLSAPMMQIAKNAGGWVGGWVT